MVSVYTDTNIDSIERREKIFGGDVFVYAPSKSTLELCNLARELIEEAFDPYEPETAQEYLSVQEYAKILADLKPRFIHHDQCKHVLAKIIEDTGESPESTYFDVPRLRSSTSNGFLTSGIAYAFHPHRDTWYSAPHCQINRWIPEYPVEADNGMAIHPEYFGTDVENSSSRYDYYRWNAQSRADALLVNEHRRAPNEDA